MFLMSKMRIHKLLIGPFFFKNYYTRELLLGPCVCCILIVYIQVGCNCLLEFHMLLYMLLLLSRRASSFVVYR